MKIRLALYLASLLLSALSVARADSNVAITAQQQASLGIRLGYPQAATLQPLLSASAMVVVPPSKEQIVNAPQPGFVQQLLVTVGDTVEQGQALAVINSPTLTGLQNGYLQALNKQQLALSSYQREQNLFAEGIISKRRWTETQANYQALQSEKTQALALLQMAGMSTDELRQLRNKRVLNSRIRVHAPLDGVVLERSADVGQKVEMLAALFHIASLQQLWLEIQVPQQQVQRVAVADQVVVGDGQATAIVELIANSVDARDQTVMVRAAIVESGSALRVGQRVTATMSRQQSTDTYIVPAAAIARRAGQAYLFVKTVKGFVASKVTVLGREAEQMVVQAQLDAKQQIAIENVVAIKAVWMGLGGDE